MQCFMIINTWSDIGQSQSMGVLKIILKDSKKSTK